MTLTAKTKARKEKREKQKTKAEGEITVTANASTTSTKTTIKSRRAKVKTATLKEPDVPKAKFRKRQVHKAWLPTHIFHAKRAHMTPPKEPLWRFAIPLSPTDKVYRVTHRASTMRGAVAWDTSYMSTIGLQGPEKSIEGLLKALGVGLDDDREGIWKSQGSKWRKGLRSLEVWVYQRESWPSKCIGPATVIWNPVEARSEAEATAQVSTGSQKKPKRQAFIRINPAGFLQLWEEVIRLAKVQKPSVIVEDLRFEIGSIEITGPHATEVLAGTLWLDNADETENRHARALESVWPTMASITNPTTLPANAVIGLETSDPRLHHPPRTVTIENEEDAFEKSIEIMAKWPFDDCPTPASVFDRNARLKAGRSLPSQKSINRRKGAAQPGEYPHPLPNDPRIPILMFNSRNSGSQQGSWTVMLPWKCVLPVWTCFMYYPLSCGNNPRFAGLEEKRQLVFESGTPWFPGDFPGTKAGDEWERRESAKRRAEWDRRPKSRRIAYDKVDLGRGRKGEVGDGWACDWQKLGELVEQPAPAAVSDGNAEEMGTNEEAKAQNTQATPSETSFYHLPHPFATCALSDSSSPERYSQALVTVRLKMLAEGIPKTCARIYRLPTNDSQLRQQWLSVSSKQQHKSRKDPQKKALSYSRPSADASHADYQAYLAAKILDSDIARKPGTETYPVVPDDIDLIGFVTTGNFNLSEGLGTGVGSIALAKILEGPENSNRKEQRMCVVRDAGAIVGRLARWELA